jgi:hypothetical protein
MAGKAAAISPATSNEGLPLKFSFRATFLDMMCTIPFFKPELITADKKANCDCTKLTHLQNALGIYVPLLAQLQQLERQTHSNQIFYRVLR